MMFDQSHTRITAAQAGSTAIQDDIVLSALLRQVDSCVFVKHALGPYVQVNQPMAELLGFGDPALIIGNTDEDLFTPLVAGMFRNSDQRVITTGQTVSDLAEFIDYEGQPRRGVISRSPLRDEAGNIIGIIGISDTQTGHILGAARDRTTSQDLRAVVEIADRLINSPDLDSLLRKSVELVRSLLRVERCAIMLNQEGQLIHTFGTDRHGRTTDERTFSYPMDEEWTERITRWNERSSHWIIDRDIRRASPDARDIPADRFWVATTPIKGTNGSIIGVFCNDSAITSSLPDEHLQDVIAVFCSLLGSIIERQRSIDEIRNRDRILDAVSLSSSQLLMAEGINPAIQESLRLLGEAMRIERATLHETRQDPFTGDWLMSLKQEWVRHPALPLLADPKWQDLPFLPDFPEMLEQLKAGHVYEGQTAQFEPEPRRLLESQQTVSFLRVPIHINGRSWGFMGFDSTQSVRRWTTNEMTTLLTMAGNLGGAISREMTRRELTSRDRVLSAVARANRELLTNPDVGLAISQALRILSPAVNAERIFLCENQAGGPQRDHPVMVPRHAYDKTSASHRIFPPGETHFPYNEYFPGWHDVLASGRMIRGRIMEFLDDGKDKVNSVLLMPLIVDSRFWGVIGFDTPETGYEWDESEVSTISTIAGSISSAIARHHAEESLRRSEEHFRSLIENASDLILMVDSRGDVLYASPSVARILGLEGTPLDRINFFNHIHTEDWNVMRDIFESDSGQPFDNTLHQFRVRHQGGEWRDMECAFRRIRNEQGMIQFIINARDITERIRTEQALRRSGELLRHSQKMEAVGRLAGGVAHDFNNLLTAILGYSDLLVEQIPDGHAWKKEILEISGAAARAHSLTRQLLAFSRRQVLEPKSLDLNLVVMEMERLLKRLISENILLVTSLDPAACNVKVDRGQIEQVIANLCLNARDAMPEGGELRIVTQQKKLRETLTHGMVTVPPGDYVQLTVTDTGEGIADDAKPHIFEPFFTTKEVGKGTGLGLSMVYGIVEQSAGYILFDSTVDVGSSFMIYFPRTPAAETAPAERPMPSQAGGPEHILLIEDDKIVRELSIRILESKGYHVTTRENGEQGLEYFTRHSGSIDLVLTDIIMPRMSGLSFAQAARKLKPEQRIVFMSGYAEDHQPASHEVGDGRNYIQKPFTVSTLCSKVREILDSPVTAP